MITVPLSVAPDRVAVSMEVAANMVSVPLGVEIVGSSIPEYDGPYEFTPSNVAQTISIAEHEAMNDIIIDPIPSDWGHITWNGSVITVS